MRPDNRTDAEVQASLISNLIRDGMPVDLAPEAAHAYVHKHSPEAGGYYVVYADGYNL